MGMGEQRVILRHQALEPVLQITTRGRVGILLYCQAGRGVLQEQGTQPLLNPRLSDQRCHLGRYLMQPLGTAR